ncbi:MAG: cadherin-like beta sandwich domain-containing protein [Erysipelotrichaceae bacterium]
MLKINNKIKIGLCCFLLIISCVSTQAQSVSPNSTFTVSVSCGVIEGSISATPENATLVSIGNDGFCNRGASISATAIAGSSGRSTITFKGVDASDNTSVPPVDASGVTIGVATVDIIQPNSVSRPSAAPNGEPKADPRSKDNNLSSLSIDQGKLTPDFNAETTSYSVNLPPKTTSLTIDAKAADEKASVKGTGKVEVKPGDNQIEVVCTSEYGTDKVYTIVANVDEKPEVYMDYNGMKLGVVRNMNHISVPEGFNEIKMKYNKKEIPAWENKVIKKTIVYLSDEKNNKKFYLFENGKVTSSFELQTILGRKFFLIDVDKDHQNREGMDYKKIKIENIELMGWTFKDPKLKDYSIIEVMDMDGKIRDYQYEKSQNSLQLYSNEAAVIKASLMKDMSIWKYLSLGLGIILVGGLGYVVYIFRKEKSVK